MTPNRPEAICLMAERSALALPSAFGTSRFGFSPPSPVLDLPPRRFIARASVACASSDIEPYDMAPVQKRRTMFDAGSTAATSTGSRSDSKASIPRRLHPSLSLSVMSAYFLYSAGEFSRDAACRCWMATGSFRWRSAGTPSLAPRQWYSPALRSVALSARPSVCEASARAGKPMACSAMASSASWSKPTPSTRDAVPLKHFATTDALSPSASKICAPLYEASVEMPILAKTLSMPCSTAWK